MITKTCVYCGQEFQGKRSDARFCGSTCKARSWDRKAGKFEEPTIQASLRGVVGGPEAEETLSPAPKTIQIESPNPQYISLSNQLRSFINEKDQVIKMQKKLMDERQLLFTDISPMIEAGMVAGGAYLADRTMQKPVNVILGGIAGGLIHHLYRSMTRNDREKTNQEELVKISVQLSNLDVRLTSLNRKIAPVQWQLTFTPKTILKTTEAPIKSTLTNDFRKPQTDVQIRPKDVQQSSLQAPTLPPAKIEEGKIKSSIEVGKMEFKALGFQGSWQEFLGLPALDFSMVIHGLPGQGKSTFALLFALYLAENFGKVIYITAEEGFSKTMQDKLNLNKAFHEDLHIADLRSMEEIIKEVKTNRYNFIFIDSLNKLNIETDRMRELRKLYKGAAMITVSQSTKDGKLRGSLEIVHDCDIAVAVNDGIAKTTKNRFKETPREFAIFENRP